MDSSSNISTSLVDTTPELAFMDQARGGFTELDGETYYRISDYDRLPPFLMTVASDCDLWMFISSAGGLTAGRVDPDGALFPYETVDKLHDAHHFTGPLTRFRVSVDQTTRPWHPFAPAPAARPIERNLYKNPIGNRLVFEEVHHDLQLSFRYRWAATDTFGWVRTATLTNLATRPVRIDVLDGLRNVLPFGAPLSLYQQASSLVNAYKRTDCDPESGLATFALTSAITDRAEAAEMLRANVVWSAGLDEPVVALSQDAPVAFERGERVAPETTWTGRRGSYFLTAELQLASLASKTWHLVADGGRSHGDVAALHLRLLEGDDVAGAIDEQLDRASASLRRNVASADGVQLTADAAASTHHFANVLFNNMRGGVFANGYEVHGADFAGFVRARNAGVAERQASVLESLPETVSQDELLRIADGAADADFSRLALEYVPIWFGRRHGDPSRPWNRFSIHVKDADGSQSLQYQGNWRDIFQNWEALSTSFPGFLPHLVAKFVNASTMDGFNPYRITRDGIDWEIVEPEDPWSNIGYWGDHQIIYLLKLLEALQRYAPGTLESFLHRRIFCYADVPYRLAAYQAIVDDPYETIQFDDEHAARIEERVQRVGSDGKLVTDESGAVVHVTLLEKLLVPALSKLSNLVLDGGVWMNTQRPEWNDANNALAGNGLSVVTLCYLRRYLTFVDDILAKLDGDAALSTAVASWLESVHVALRDAATDDSDRPRLRRTLLDAVGVAFCSYRAEVGQNGIGGSTTVSVADLRDLCAVARTHVDASIHASRRSDQLYHAYNLIDIRDETIEIRPLYEMLEGQVAALSSGLVDAEETVSLIDRMFDSALHRRDLGTFLLYPERRLRGFMARNVVPMENAGNVPLLRDLLLAEDTSIIELDALGICRFHADFRNARDLAAALDRLSATAEWREAVGRDRRLVLELFETTFDHGSFTGRSGTMYGYEGLGCIYWHMVAKLLLAVQEVTLRAVRDGEPADRIEALGQAYYRVRAGLGFEKTVSEYGAFPTDPYSHTPRHAGARQPGMTGQVKEEILTRIGELGVSVEDGCLSFRPLLLRRREFCELPTSMSAVATDGSAHAEPIPANGLAFTVCQVPVVYQLTSEPAWIRTIGAAGENTIAGDTLDAATSAEIFGRTGAIRRVEVGVNEATLFGA